MEGAIQRFFGMGGGLQNSTLGVGPELVNLGQIHPEFLGKIREAQNVRFSDTTPARAIEEEREASQLATSAKVYAARLRSAQKKSGAFVEAAVANINHGVALDSQNSRLVAAQGRAITNHARNAWQNGMNGATASGSVKGYTQENSVFQF